MKKSPSKKVVDTTGAGDSFAAGFIYGITKNKSLGESALLANACAGISVSKKGARASPTEEELLKAANTGFG